MIRQATPKDIPVILDLYAKGLIELGETDIYENLLLKKVVNSLHLAPCFLMIKDGNIEGMAGMTVVTTSHSGVAMLCDYMFYVQPEHRNLKALSELVENIKQFAREKDMPVKLEFITDNDQKLRERVLEMHGFKVYSVSGIYYGK